MTNQINDMVDSIKSHLKERPMSISEIAEKVNIDWRTAENYLSLLKGLGLVKEKGDTKKTRIFYYLNQDHYFKLPIKEKDSKLISSIYYYIKKTCIEIYKKEPTKTQAYKIIWKLNEDLKLKLPLGWYQYGPCCVQVYKGDEQDYGIDSKISSKLKEIVEDYCKYDSLVLQKKLYEVTGNQLYITKSEFVEKKFKGKNELNLILMDLIKYAPTETKDIITDFARTVLLIGWEKSLECFNDYIWRYMALVKFKETLSDYYENYGMYIISEYLDEKIVSFKKEAQLIIKNLVQSKIQEIPP